MPEGKIIEQAYNGGIKVFDDQEGKGVHDVFYRVPRANGVGGVKGSKSPFGRIVAGRILKGAKEEDIGPDTQSLKVLQGLADFIDGSDGVPVGLDDVEEPKASKAPAKKRRARRKADPDVVEKVSGNNALLDALEEYDEEDEDEDYLPPAPPPPPAPAPAPAVRYTLRGPFGTYRGRCRALALEGRFLVIISGRDEDLFSPPPSGEDALELDTGGERYTLFFVGIEFPIEALDAYVQVFFLEEADAGE